MLFLRTLCTYPALVFGTVAGGLLVIPSVLLGDREGKLWWPYVVQPWARLITRVGGVTHLEIVGDASRLRGFYGVVMSNHGSHFDPPSLILSSEAPLRFMAKQSLSRFPILGRAMREMGMLFIDRGDKEKAWESIARAAESLREGKTVLVVPEGTRSREGSALLPFKRGGFVLAMQGKAPILPIGIAGTSHVLPPGWSVRGTGPVVVAIGEPIETEGREDIEALMAETRAAIEALRARAEDARAALLGAR